MVKWGLSGHCWGKCGGPVITVGVSVGAQRSLLGPSLISVGGQVLWNCYEVTVSPVAAMACGVVTVAPVVTVAAVWPHCCVVNSRALGPWGGCQPGFLVARHGPAGQGGITGLNAK